MVEAQTLLSYCVEKGLLQQVEADEALRLSAEWKTSVPRTLLAMGVINSLSLYQTIAEVVKLPFANLQTNPCDPLLLDYCQRNDYHQLQLIPWKKKDEKWVLACVEENQAVHRWATQHYGAENYSLAITSAHDIHMALYRVFSKEDDLRARETLWEQKPESSAKELVLTFSPYYWWGAVAMLIASFYFFPAYSLISVFVIANGFYITTLLVKLGLFMLGRSAYQQKKKVQGVTAKSSKALPVYTLLVPLYKETAVLRKLTDALLALDYPKAKLDIKLIVEEDDDLTIEAIKALKCRRIFEMIRVPYSLPRTKPKACNYALQFARGEYVTIYDAEDVPDPQQLKKALWCFEQADEQTVCVQARLNYFNRKENWLTRMFALEYSGLFDFLLWGIERLNIPIPLGGTSNHFRMDALKALYAWDPYNVTEDADLGIRVAKQGWKVTVMDSLTLEEAPVALEPWIKQRSRWIKGHMQTYLVHMRKPFRLWRELGAVGFFGFQFFLGAPCLVFLISPILWGLWSVSLVGIIPYDFASLSPAMHWMVPFSVTIFFSGLLLQIFFAIWTLVERRWWKMLPFSLLYPFYWFLHSIASFRALWQLFKRPHYWEKTTHGVTKIKLETHSKTVIQYQDEK